MMEKVPLEIVFQYGMVDEIRMVPSGPGWYGNRYSCRTTTGKWGGPFESFSDLRRWLIELNGYWIHSHIQHNCPRWADAFKREWKGENID